MKDVLVYGSLEFGRVVFDLVQQCGYSVAGFVDDYNVGNDILGTFDSVKMTHPPSSYSMVIAVGYQNLSARANVAEKVRSAGYFLPVLIHPCAYVRHKECLGSGSMVMAGAVVDVNVTVGDLVVIWPGVVVNHDSTVGANTFLSPNCTICGCVDVGSNCFVGAGATVVDHVSIPSGSFVKAGALFVNKSLPI